MVGMSKTKLILALGLTLLAGGQTASNAMATNYFHSHQENTILTGESLGAQLFTLAMIGGGGLPIECQGATLAGTEIGEKHSSKELGTTFTTTSVTVHPEYYGAGGPGSNCNIKGFSIAIHTHTGACHYRFAAETSELGEGQFHNECGAGAIELSTTIGGSTCIVKIGTQTAASGGVSYSNSTLGGTGKWDIRAIITVEGMEFSSNSAPGCSVIGIPKNGSATYTGEFTVKGYKDLKKTNTGEYSLGEQTGIWHGKTE